MTDGADAGPDVDLSQFLASPLDLFAVIAPDGTFVWLSENWTRVLGWSLEEMLGRHAAELIHGDDVDPTLSLGAGMTRAGDEISQFTNRYRTKRGGHRWLEWSARRADSLIYATARDVTDRVERDIRLRTRTRLLELGEGLAGLGHWVLHLPDYRLEWSPEVFRIHGLDPSPEAPGIDEAFGFYHPEDRASVTAIVEHAIDAEEGFSFVKRLVGADGRLRYVSCAARVDADETGVLRSVYGVFRDVTDEIRAESRLREAKETAERASRAKSEFLASMSHELRTPLNAIIGFSEMIRDGVLGPIENPRYRTYAGDIHRSGTLLLNLVNDILDLSKIESGRFDLTAEDVDIGEVVANVVATLRLKARRGGVSVTSAIDPGVLHAVTNPRALEQVMINLVSNAIQYSSAGDAVTIAADAGNGALTLTVADQGCGIPEDRLATVIQPFERIDNRVDSHHSGTGLGLAVVHGLVEAQGGRLRIESTVDVGTTVMVTLPLHPMP